MNNVLFDVKTRQPVSLPVEKIPQALADGTHSYQADAKINITKDGKSFNVDGRDVSSALQQGYQLETPKQTAVREYLKDNKGVSGSAKVALGQFADEALMGIPETILEKTGDPFEVAKWEALKKEHGAANALGGVAGFGASLALGEPLFKGAELAGKAAERSIVGETAGKASELASADALANLFAAQGVKRGSSQLASEIVKKTAGAAARMGVEGAVINAPKAITEASLGDPEQAAETLLYGVGGGMLFGGLATAGGAIAKTVPKALDWGSSKVGELGEKVSQELTDAAATKENLGPELGAAYQESSPTAQKLKEAFGRKIGSSTAGLAGLSHGPVGGVLGYKIGEGAGELASKVIPDEMVKSGLLFTEQAMKKTAESLDKINEVVGRLADRGFSGAAVASNAFARFVNSDASHKEKMESFKTLQDNLDTLNADPNLLINNASQISGKIADSAPNIADAYSRKQMQALGYLTSNIPRNPRPPNPFMHDPWQPTDKQLKDFHDKVEIVHDPFVALNHLETGTLTASHMDSLSNNYPKLLGQMQKKIIMAAAAGKLPSMTYPVRNKLSMFLQQPLDANMYHSMQDDFKRNLPEPKGHDIKMPFEQTSINRISGT